MGDRSTLRRVSGAIVSLAVLAAYPAVGQQLGSQTRIVLLGTGAVRADPQRSGPATAIVVNDTPYIVDAGPGIVRRAAAAFNKGVKDSRSRGFRPPSSPICTSITRSAIPI